jgi:hypothetical protein
MTDIPRGKIIGKVTDGPPLNEAQHFWKCEFCGGWFDMRDLARRVVMHRPDGRVTKFDATTRPR